MTRFGHRRMQPDSRRHILAPAAFGPVIEHVVDRHQRRISLFGRGGSHFERNPARRTIISRAGGETDRFTQAKPDLVQQRDTIFRVAVVTLEYRKLQRLA